MRLIGVAGRSGSGKTTFAGKVAAALLDCGRPAILDALATPLKKAVYPSNLDPGEDRERYRRALQETGAEWRRRDPDCLIKLFAKRNEGMAGRLVIVPDVRYPNEAAWIKRHGMLVHIVGSLRPLAGEAAAHESERHGEDLAAMADYFLSAPATDNDARDVAWLYLHKEAKR